MADPVYFDTNTLIYWALGSHGSSKAEELRCAEAIEQLVNGDGPLACSPLTLAEFTTVIWNAVRSGKPELSYFGNTEAETALEALMGLLATGRLRVNHLHPRAFEVGIALVADGTREKDRACSVPDAMHMFEAAQWARSIDHKVVVATTDSDFDGLMQAFPEFERYIEIRDLTKS